MIFEFFKHLFTPCPEQARTLGHLSGLIIFEAHSRRCRAAWEPHQRECRRLILEAALACPRRREVLVAGSGLLLEIPLEDLSRLFGRVVLCDVLHMPAVHRRVRRLPNVELATRDLTGLDGRFLDFVQTRCQPDLSVPIPADFLERDGLDLVVSANLLTQLPLPFIRLLSRCVSDLPHEVLDLPPEVLGLPDKPWEAPPEVLDRLGRDVVAAHLAWLSRFQARVCLITDVERLYTDQGRVLERLDPLFGVELPRPDREWVWDIAPRPDQEWAWDIAPRPELPRDRDVQHRVFGFLDFRQAGPGPLGS